MCRCSSKDVIHLAAPGPAVWVPAEAGRERSRASGGMQPAGQVGKRGCQVGRERVEGKSKRREREEGKRREKKGEG